MDEVLVTNSKLIFLGKFRLEIRCATNYTTNHIHHPQKNPNFIAKTLGQLSSNKITVLELFLTLVKGHAVKAQNVDAVILA